MTFLFKKGDRVRIKPKYHPSCYENITGTVISYTTSNKNLIDENNSFIEYHWACNDMYRVLFDNPVNIGENTFIKTDVFMLSQLEKI